MQPLNYKIYLIAESGNYAELDTEGLDFNTTFSVANIKDISEKKDTISKNIILKGTKNNNKVFGNMFSQSRFVDDNIAENLFINFSLNRSVQCLILENTTPILKGFLKLKSVTIYDNNIVYECYVTGNVFNLFSLLSDKKLSDLDFSEYEHQFNVSNITQNWFGLVYYNSSASTYPVGKGYVYPFINYGDLSSPYPADVNKIHINNFRPALYLTEYYDKIFKQPELSGYTYEFKGSGTFLDNLKHLIIPDNGEFFGQTAVGSNLVTITQSATIGNGGSVIDAGSVPQVFRKALNFSSITDPLDFLIGNTTAFNSLTNNVFQWQRDVNSDILITLNASVNNTNSNSIECKLQFLERDYVNPSDTGNYNSFSNFTLVAEQFIDTVGGNSSINKAVSLTVPQRTFNAKKQFLICFYAQGTSVDFISHFTIGLTSATLTLPSVPDNLVTYSVTSGDMVKPRPATNVKQADFIKSVNLLFNLYTYSELSNPKHIIFEPYDDYYSYCKPQNIKDAAIDLTKKIDYSDKVVISSFDESAKQYNFTYKADSDYFNSLYSSNYSSIYGSFTQTSKVGSVDTNKVEVIFSSTPLVKYNNTGRITPEIYKLDGNNFRSSLTTNIRIMYYNGLKNCEGYQIGLMQKNDSTFTFTPEIPFPYAPGAKFTSYPQVGHFRFASGLTNYTYIDDLNFGLASQYYFPADLSQLNTLSNSYNYYSNQITELTDLNTVILEVTALLNEVDISNLDLKKPIFINNQYGNSYYKVLEVEYNNSKELTPLKLQKVSF